MPDILPPDILPPGHNSPFYSARWRSSSTVFHHVYNRSSSSYNRTTLPVTTPLWQQQQICSSRSFAIYAVWSTGWRSCLRLKSLKEWHIWNPTFQRSTSLKTCFRTLMSPMCLAHWGLQQLRRRIDQRSYVYALLHRCTVVHLEHARGYAAAAGAHKQCVRGLDDKKSVPQTLQALGHCIRLVK